MIKLRLKRMGRAKRPFYRLVAMKADAPRDGQGLAQVGTYDPLYAKVSIDEAETLRWLEQGAQMTATVEALLKSQGILARWRGQEGKVREDALRREKPARRRKLKGQAAPPPAAPAESGG